MKIATRLPFLAALAALAALPFLPPPPRDASAQAAGPASAALAAPDPGYSRLRGIQHFYMDVTSSTNATDEAELRNELRDVIELELRRANLALRPLSASDSPETATPFLRLNLKWERTTGRADCILELSVLDKVSILRNREQITATIFEIRRPANILTEQTAARDIKARTQDLIREFMRGVKRVN